MKSISVDKVHLEDYDVALDVRGFEERLTTMGWIPTSVVFPLPQIQAGELPNISKDAKILMICRSGKRSETALNILQAAGYTNLTNLDGGTMGWAAAGRPTADTAKHLKYVEEMLEQTITAIKIREELVNEFTNLLAKQPKLKKEEDPLKILMTIFENSRCDWNSPTKIGLGEVINQLGVYMKPHFELSSIADLCGKMFALIQTLS